MAGRLSFPAGISDSGSRGGQGVMENFIKTGHMPPGARLTQEERNALYRCLMREYYGGFLDPRAGGAAERGTWLRALDHPACPDTIAPRTGVSESATGAVSAPIGESVVDGPPRAVPASER
jgi:hypothetical protein